jgi:hypothetical protein
MGNAKRVHPDPLALRTVLDEGFQDWYGSIRDAEARFKRARLSFVAPGIGDAGEFELASVSRVQVVGLESPGAPAGSELSGLAACGFDKKV